MGRVYSMLPEWLNANSHRDFPLEENSVSFKDDRGVSGPPTWMLLDFRLVSTIDRRMVQPGSNDDVPSDSCRLKSYRAIKSDSGLAYELIVSYMDRYDIPVSSSGIVPFGGTKRITTRYSAVGGTVLVYTVFGAPEKGDYDDSYEGMHVFDDGPEFIPSRHIWIPGGVGVNSLRTNKVGVSTPEELYVRDGKNTSFRIENGRLKLSVGYSLGEGIDCLPEKEAEKLKNSSTYLHSINGVRPDSTGNLVVKAGPGVVIESGTYNGIPAIIVSTSSTVDSFARPR